MFNVTPIKGMMTVIYEFPVDEETTLQNYDIYFTNEELTDDQKALIEWYRDVFRPEDLRPVESVQKGLKSAAIAAGRIMADNSGSGISEHGIAHFHNLVARVPAVIVEGACYVCVSLRSVSPAGADCRKLARRRRRHDACRQQSFHRRDARPDPQYGACGSATGSGCRRAALPDWRAFTAAQRAALLKNWHRLILENKSALAQIMTAEQGKPLAEAEGEIAYAASFIEWFAEQGKRANGEIIPSPAPINA